MNPVEDRIVIGAQIRWYEVAEAENARLQIRHMCPLQRLLGDLYCALATQPVRSEDRIVIGAQIRWYEVAEAENARLQIRHMCPLQRLLGDLYCALATQPVPRHLD